jgi:exonuclease III
MGRMLRVLEWNANGLLQKRQELQLFLDEQKIDACLLAETHLTNQSYIKIKGCQVYHTVHPQHTASGSSAVLIKDNMIHHEEAKHARDEIQATVVTVKTKRQAITFVAVYRPPRYNLKKTDYLNFLSSLGERFVVGGDYNAKNIHWRSRLTTRKGKEL